MYVCMYVCSPEGSNLIIARVCIPYHTQNRGLNSLYHVLWAWCLLSISWPKSKAAGSPSTEKCRLSLSLKRKDRFAEPLQ